MHTITNTSNKLIHINKKSLLPADIVSVTDEVAKLPAVQAMAKMGLLKVEKAEGAKKPTAKAKKEDESGNGETDSTKAEA